MHILIVPDSFKGSLSSTQVGERIRDGLRSVLPQANFRLLPVADGGEGTVEAVSAAAGGTAYSVQVTGPMGNPVSAQYAVLPDGTAVLEMAQASGLPLVPLPLRDPSQATTRGTGELISAALDQGCSRILIGIGGSATNDGGAGMARALGARFLDRNGQELAEGGGALEGLDRIDLSGLDPRLARAEFLVASDVTAPLCGPQGASLVFGPQKGASPQQAARLDRCLAHYGQVLEATFHRPLVNLPGAGAAGGLGAGLMAFCNAQLQPGIDIIFDLLHLEQEAAQADLIVTGEGRIDATSATGKLLSGVGRLARQYQKPAIAFAGAVALADADLQAIGLQTAIPICDGPMALEDSLSQASALTFQAAQRTARLIRLGSSLATLFSP